MYSYFSTFKKFPSCLLREKSHVIGLTGVSTVNNLIYIMYNVKLLYGLHPFHILNIMEKIKIMILDLIAKHK